MPAGWDSYAQAVDADGPVGWYRFAELLVGSGVSAGGQDPQSICMDASKGAELPLTTDTSVPGYGTIVLSGIWVGGTDTVSPVINGVSNPYATVSGDTVLTVFAVNFAADINTQYAGLVTATASGTTVSINAVALGTVGNYTLTCTNDSSAGLSTASGATMTGGATFTQPSAHGIGSNVLHRGGNLQYGSAVLPNVPSLLSTQGPNRDGGSALFPSTATLSLANIAYNPAGGSAILEPPLAVTVECWFKPNVIGDDVTQVLVCYGTAAAGAPSYILYHSGGTPTTHSLKFAVDVAGSMVVATATVPLLVVGHIYHVVGTYDGVNVKIYVNSVLQGTTAGTGAITYAAPPGLGLAFGNDPSLTDANIEGYLDEVAIYRQALSASRIAYHYRQGSMLLPFVWNH